MQNQAVDITAALAVDGWMQPKELQWLAETASKSKLAVELGSYVGRSSRAIADNLPKESQLICVDDWYGPRDTHIPDDIRSLIPDRFGKNMASSPAVQQGRVFGWKVDLSTVTPELIRKTWGEGFQTDFLFIDGDHSYEAVKHDIQAWLPFLAPGGIISGHDYGFGFPSVRQAVDELLPHAKQVPDTSIWAWKMVEEYEQ